MAAITCAMAIASVSACTGSHAPAASDTSASATTGQATAEHASAAQLPAITHVFIIVLENRPYDTTFGPNSPAPFLADTMTAQGALLTHYYGTGHFSLDNYISMISGQAPNKETQADCGAYIDFVQTGTAADGQAIGKGCIYPAKVLTIADQLEEQHLTWKGYMEDMGNDPTREPATCGHVAVGARDVTHRATPTDQYAAKHNPFMYFHSVIDEPSCQTNVVPLTRLVADLQSAATTPNYSFIAPSLCHDGHDTPCVNGEPGGLTSANAFLAKWVPRIVQSPAFRQDGLLIVTFDEAAFADATACCDEQTGPNTDKPGVHGPGGGRIGAVLISPFITPGTVSNTPYNHYSMLKSVEDLFHLSHLGYAGRAGLVGFGADVYTNPGATVKAE